MKVVHAADLHLDSPLRGLSRYEGAPVARVRLATRQAFENLVDLCRREEVDLLLLAGDIFDGDWRDFATGLFFVGQLQRLREVGTRVVLLHGNHDAASPITRELNLPEHVHLLSSSKPETLEQGPIAVHGQSFPQREVLDDLAENYPDPIDGCFNIGVLHTALSGRPGHAPYAPTRLEVLEDRGYQYWALGHVHAREVVRQTPWVVFPGNLQGRHIRETGAKGATQFSVRDGQAIDLRHVPLDVVRWAQVEVACDGSRDLLDIHDRCQEAFGQAVEAAEDRLLALRLRFTNRHAAPSDGEHERFVHNLRIAALEHGDVWLEKVIWAPTPAEASAPDPDGALPDALQDMLRHMRHAEEDPALLQALAKNLEDLDRKLPREAREGEDAVRPEDPAYLADALQRASASLTDRLYPDPPEERPRNEGPKRGSRANP